ncbi:DUF397 domain-containing protein [Nocardia pseudobrasiliensis]|uniref:Uncharacterized protein DUF397 n=1 Tax=Nocardia pseudobrasiliensis TaxID=45979 RepID=A0A370I905_9NOCA|nr:DUF397 domain-containing protein [Nocardia pseudobrasiliensis]RDI66591.1 uncharacterized protein DUF397 [Nocardia pseudobrasiliensis]
MDAELSAANWFKSSRSSGGKECVEVAFLTNGHIGIRDSKNPTGPALVVSPAEWDAFTTAVQAM